MCFGVGKKDRQPGTTAVDRAGALNGTATDDAALYDTGMSTTLERVRGLTAVADIKISDHGYDELSKDGLTVGEVVDGLETAEVVEDYPEYGKGPWCWCSSVTRAARRSTRYGGFRRGKIGRRC